MYGLTMPEPAMRGSFCCANPTAGFCFATRRHWRSCENAGVERSHFALIAKPRANMQFRRNHWADVMENEPILCDQGTAVGV
jgi:hypothetical protein